MANGLVFFNNIFPLYEVLSVTSEDADYPKSFLDSENPKKFCKAGSTGDQNIKVDMGASWNKAIKGAVLVNVNLSAGNTFNFQADADDIWTPSPDQSQAMTLKTRTFEYGGYSYLRKAIFISGLSWNYRYMRYNLAIASGYVEGAVPFIFKDQYEFGTNYQWKYQAGEMTVSQITPGGKGMRYKKVEYGSWNANLYFKGISDAQIDEINYKLKYQDYVVFMPTGITGNIYLGIMEFDLPGHQYFENWNIGATFYELPYVGKQT